MSTKARAQALEAMIEAYALELKLPTLRRRFRALADEALREQQTPVAYLAALLEAEMSERAERRERRRMIDARFPVTKRLEDFSFADNPSVSPSVIAALAEGGWIADRESVILIGESGTGKTMLATGLAVAACQQGRRVRFTTLAGLATELQEAESRRELARVVGRYARTELVVLDELGGEGDGGPREAGEHGVCGSLRGRQGSTRAVLGSRFVAHRLTGSPVPSPHLTLPTSHSV